MAVPRIQLSFFFWQSFGALAAGSQYNRDTVMGKPHLHALHSYTSLDLALLNIVHTHTSAVFTTLYESLLAPLLR